MGVLKLLSNDNFIAVNKTLAKTVGLDEAVILGELASEYNYYEANDMLIDGLFYSTVENVEDKTTLSDYRQRKALKNLQEAGLLEVRRKGVPAKRYILLREDRIAALFQNKNSKNCRTESQETEEQEPEKVQGNKKRENKTISKKKEEKTPVELVEEFTDDEGLKASLRDFIDDRKKRRDEVTSNGMKRLLSKLASLSSDTATQTAIVDESIMKGWKGFFPLKDNKSQSASNHKTAIGPNGVEYRIDEEEDEEWNRIWGGR
jgi:hypothetical protein